MLDLKRLFRARYLLFLVLIVNFGCTQRKEELNFHEEIKILNCESACLKMIYELSISMHNFESKNESRSFTDEELVNYCLSTDTQCGGKLYYSLKELIEYDSIKFKYLSEKYDLDNPDSFNQKIKTSSFGFLHKLDDIRTEIISLCDCK